MCLICSPTSTKVLVGGPDGGDGGDGGSVVFEADASTRSMCSLLSHYRAKDGADGRGSYNLGRSGKDVVIKVRVWLGGQNGPIMDTTKHACLIW